MRLSAWKMCDNPDDSCDDCNYYIESLDCCARYDDVSARGSALRGVAMEKEREIDALEDNANQAEGYAEAAKSGFQEIGDEEGEAKADAVLEKIAEVRKHIRERTEK
jgi:hypothetical protein